VRAIACPEGRPRVRRRRAVHRRAVAREPDRGRPQARLTALLAATRADRGAVRHTGSAAGIGPAPAVDPQRSRLCRQGHRVGRRRRRHYAHELVDFVLP
jgi:hypothetical protein